jgi:beta-glucosidase
VEHLGWRQDRISEAVIVAKHSDVVVLCLGLDETLEGEEGDTGNSYASGDKTDLELPEVQRELLEAVCATGKPVVLCLMAGSAMNLSYADEHADAILQAWYPGARGGKVIAQILFGDIAPSGKLPVTFYHNTDALPDFEDYSMKGRTYRYLNEEPLYPFGYGLTYGRTEVVSAAFEQAPSHEEDFSVSVEVRNTGAVAVTEVVQLYIKNLDSAFAVPNHSLCGFTRVSLAAGESRKVSVPVRKEALLQVNEDGKFVADGSKFVLYAGISQPDARSAELTGTKPVEIAFEL